MFHDTDLPKSAAESPDIRCDADGERQAAASPVRFGRLALCVATASALAVGVVGTVAYGVWFNHDQQRYADAIAGARQALGTPASTVAERTAAASIAPPERVTASMQATAATPSTEEAGEEAGQKEASWSGAVTRPLAPALSQTVVTDSAQGASSVPAVLHTAPPSNPGAQPLGGGRSAKTAHLAQPDRRSASTVNTRHKSSLFARMGSFFRRVSYRQHGTGSQQDLYSHP